MIEGVVGAETAAHAVKASVLEFMDDGRTIELCRGW